MEIAENNQRATEITSRLLGKHFPTREGIHLSDLTDSCTRKTYFRMREPGVHSPELVMHWIRGAVLHTLLAVEESEWEVKLDGVVGHVDGRDGDGSLVERKTTMMSSARTEFPDHWIKRMMGYCKMAGSASFYLDIMYLVGDYRPPRLPVLKSYTLTFTQEEIDLNWQWVITRRDALTSALDTDVPPGVEMRLGDWECKGCPWLTRCLPSLGGYDVKQKSTDE